MIRLARAVAGGATGLTLLLATTACNTSPGAAALVGGDRISVAALQSEVNLALADPHINPQISGDRAGFTRSELGRLINNRIIAATAAAHHVTVPPAEVDQAISSFAQQAGGMTALVQQAASSGIPQRDLHTVIYYYVLGEKLKDALVANVPVTHAQLAAAYQQNINNYDQVHAAHILVKSKQLADSILAQVKADPSKFASLAAKYSLDTSNKSSGGDLGFQGQSAFVKPFADAIFAAKPGSYIEVHSQFGWHVVHVIEHKVETLAQATPQLRSKLLSAERDKLFNEALAVEAKRLGVHVNPRYGVWDEAKNTVVAATAKGAVSSPSPAA